MRVGVPTSGGRPTGAAVPDGAGSILRQRALFHPRGVAGRLYWYALIPFHALIFKRLCQRLAAAAEVTARDARPLGRGRDGGSPR